MTDNRKYLTEEEVRELLKQSQPLPQSKEGPYEWIEDGDFVFSDLIRLDERSLQLVLRRTIAEHDVYVISKAIKQGNTQFIDKILANVSKRMKEEIIHGLKRIKEIQSDDTARAQQKMVDVVQQYAKRGEIIYWWRRR